MNGLKKKKLLLHIGLHKTGTTSIQQFLKLNIEQFRNLGVFIPDFSSYNYEFHGIHHPYAYILKTKDVKKIEKENESILKNSGECNSVLISSEIFCTSDFDIAFLMESLSGFFHPIQIIVYLRRQDFMSISSYSQQVKAGSIDKLFNQNNPVYYRNDYHKLLQNWSEVFGKENIKVAVFENESFYNNDLISDFLYKTLKLTSNKGFILPEIKFNQSLNIGALEFFRITFSLFPDVKKRDLIESLEKYSSENQSEENSLKCIFSYESRLKFLKKFDESNRKVAEEYLSKGRQNLFSELVSFPKGTYRQNQNINSTEIRRIVNSIENSNPTLFNELLTYIKNIKDDYTLDSDKQEVIRELKSIANERIEKIPNMMKNPKFIFHIGQPKTGTTSIQSFLHNNRELLFEKYSCLYPEFNGDDFVKGQNINHASVFTSAINNQKVPELVNDFSDCYEFCKKKSIKNIIISNEGFFWNWWPKILKRIVDKTGADYSVVVYLRRQDHWIESAWKQWGTKSEDYKNIIEYAEKRDLDWFKTLEHWSDILNYEKIIVRPFEKSQIGKSVLVDFLNILKLPESFISNVSSHTKKESNVGFNNNIVELLQLTKSLAKNQNDHRIINFFESTLSEMTKRKSVDDYPLLSPNQRIELLSKYRESNRSVAKKYLAGKNGELFLEEIPNADDEWEAYSGMNLEKFIPIVFEIMMKMNKRIDDLEEKLKMLKMK